MELAKIKISITIGNKIDILHASPNAEKFAAKVLLHPEKMLAKTSLKYRNIYIFKMNRKVG